MWIVWVKSFNYTGFSKKKKQWNFSCEQCEWINSLALVFWNLKKKQWNFSCKQCEWTNSLALVFRQCEWINSLALVFQKTKLCTLVNSYSGAMLHCSCFSQTRSSKMLLLLNQRCHVGPTHWKYFHFDYQTLINVVAGEPHPQPCYQTASYLIEKLWFKILSCYNLGEDIIIRMNSEKFNT